MLLKRPSPATVFRRAWKMIFSPSVLLVEDDIKPKDAVVNNLRVVIDALGEMRVADGVTGDEQANIQDLQEILAMCAEDVDVYC